VTTTPTTSEFKPRLLAQSTANSKIIAATSAIDVTDWLFHIDELEYTNCTPKSKAHIAAGFTHAPDGKMMSINVEYIAGALFVQHYVEDISEKLRCRVKSTSTLLMNNAFMKVGVVWEVVVKPTQGDVHELSNNVWIHTTPEFEAFLEAAHIPYEEIHKGVQAAVDGHNAEEAPEFAASIGRKALKHNAASHSVRRAAG
jgi:hypothetical protein